MYDALLFLPQLNLEQFILQLDDYVRSEFAIDTAILCPLLLGSRRSYRFRLEWVDDMICRQVGIGLLRQHTDSGSDKRNVNLILVPSLLIIQV